MYISRSIDSLAKFALLLDLAGISTKFSGVITTEFCFNYTLESVTAMPRWLHARLCHAFLVIIRYAIEGQNIII